MTEDAAVEPAEKPEARTEENAAEVTPGEGVGNVGVATSAAAAGDGAKKEGMVTEAAAAAGMVEVFNELCEDGPALVCELSDGGGVAGAELYGAGAEAGVVGEATSRIAIALALVSDSSVFLFFGFAEPPSDISVIPRRRNG